MKHINLFKIEEENYEKIMEQMKKSGFNQYRDTISLSINGFNKEDVFLFFVH